MHFSSRTYIGRDCVDPYTDFGFLQHAPKKENGQSWKSDISGSGRRRNRAVRVGNWKSKIQGARAQAALLRRFQRSTWLVSIIFASR
jgi:hypothetical protein